MGAQKGYFRCFRLKVKIVLKNLYKHELSLWGKNLQKIAKIITLGGILHHLTAKFYLKTSSVMHSNYGFPLFKKPKTPTKMKILEEKKKHHVDNFQEIMDVIFFLLPKFSF